MAIVQGRVTVGTSATSIAAPLTQNYGSGAHKVATNVSMKVPAVGQSVFVGGSTVTAANGYEIVAGASIDINMDGDDELFGIVAATTQVVHILRLDDDSH